MYIEPPFTDWELQGDVYENVPIISNRLISDKIKHTGTRELVVQTTFKESLVAVVSHSCDSAKRSHILVAELVVVSRYELEDLERHGGIGRVNDATAAEFLHQFHYLPRPQFPEEPRVINFTNVISIDRKLLVREKKVAELTAEARGLLKGKLFAHFSRKEKHVPTVEIGLPGEVTDAPIEVDHHALIDLPVPEEPVAPPPPVIPPEPAEPSPAQPAPPCDPTLPAVPPSI